MTKIDEIITVLDEMAPTGLAEPWDNCGLLISARNQELLKVAICLDATISAVKKAIESSAGLIICHHPLIFSPLKKIDIESPAGAVIHMLIEHGIALYAAHTNVDKTYGGLNDLLAGLAGLELSAGTEESANSLTENQPECFRIGELPESFTKNDFHSYLNTRLKPDSMLVSRHDGSFGVAGYPGIKRVAVMCGAFGINTDILVSEKVDAVICGEIRHHQILELTERGIHVVCIGHHGSERFFISLIDKWLKDRFPALDTVLLGYSDEPLTGYRI